jgi:isopenicillin N synthase-like dioxygenase
MTKSLSVIDLSSFGDDDRALADVSSRIGAACRDVGFFYVVNHGVGRDLMNEAFAQSKAFFALPVGEKQAIAIE